MIKDRPDSGQCSPSMAAELLAGETRGSEHRLCHAQVGMRAPRPGTGQLLTGGGALLPFLLLSQVWPWLCLVCLGWCGRSESKRMPRSRVYGDFGAAEGGSFLVPSCDPRGALQCKHVSTPGAGLHCCHKHCIVTKCCHSTSWSPSAAQSPTSSTVWLCCSPAMSQPWREKGKGTQERFPWGMAQTLEQGSRGRAKVLSWALAGTAVLPPLRAGQWEETRGANRVSITQVPALPCSPAPHT